jgi:hypothetical protein
MTFQELKSVRTKIKLSSSKSGDLLVEKVEKIMMKRTKKEDLT